MKLKDKIPKDLIQNEGCIWLFDLDNTLYQTNSNMMRVMDERIDMFLTYKCRCTLKEATGLRNHLFFKYKNTFVGALREKIILEDELPQYLSFAHNFDIPKRLVKNNSILQLIKEVAGKKYVFSNGLRSYIARVLQILNLEDEFDGYFGIEDYNYFFKPGQEPYSFVQKFFNKPADDFILIDDSPGNIETAKRMGFGAYLLASY